MGDVFLMKLSHIQPSQLWISSEKLAGVQENLAPIEADTLPPIPVKQLGSEVICTDGHTRALAAYLHGLAEIRVYWDEDELDWEAYAICVRWCKEEGIHSVADLKNRVVGAEEYELLWLRRCAAMQQELAAKRTEC